MKIAVLSDIHGNLQALEAVLAEIESFGIREIIVAGDSIIDCPQPNEVLNKIKKLTSLVIKGNREEYVLDYHIGKREEWKHHKQMASVVWTHGLLNVENLEYIKGLPQQLKLKIAENKGVRVVHGSPFATSEQLFKDKHPERLERAADSIEEEVLIFGHTHKQWYRWVNGKLMLNPGSVGVHFNKECAAEYAILSLEENTWKVDLRQVKYDIQTTLECIKEAGLFKAASAWTRITYQSMLDGYDHTGDYLTEAYKLAQEKGLDNVKFVPDEIWDEVEKLWESKLTSC